MKIMLKLALILLTLPAFGQGNRYIVYSPDRPLTWADFKAPIDEASGHKAGTHSGIKYSFTGSMSDEGISLDFTVYAFVDRAQTWSIEEEQSEDLLAHEQLHFEITEVYARKLRKALSEATFTENYKAEAQSIFDRIMEERNETQGQYDLDSNHSMDVEGQVKWNKKVATRLSQLEAFSEQKVHTGP
ncbi:MAG: DUF922 domain-containing protein [Bacteroidia bacterium]|nr:DUF922 domain-containing protein [Bacteroidia bacterium]